MTSAISWCGLAMGKSLNTAVPFFVRVGALSRRASACVGEPFFSIWSRTNVSPRAYSSRSSSVRQRRFACRMSSGSAGGTREPEAEQLANNAYKREPVAMRDAIRHLLITPLDEGSAIHSHDIAQSEPPWGPHRAGEIHNRDAPYWATVQLIGTPRLQSAS